MRNKLKDIFDKVYLPRWMVLSGDIIMIFITFVLTVFLRFSLSPQQVVVQSLVLQALVIIPFFIFGEWIVKSYHGIVRHTNITDAFRVVQSTLIGSIGALIISFIGQTFYKPLNIPFSVIFVHFFFASFALIVSRFIVRYLYQKVTGSSGNKENILIFGAGELGIIAKNLIYTDNRSPYNVSGFIDDSHLKQGKSVVGLMVYSLDTAINQVVADKNVKEIIFAIYEDRISRERKREVVDICIENNLMIREISDPTSWINGKFNVNQIKKISIEDLLGRPPIDIKEPVVVEGIRGKRIMVTGGAGSIGSEIVRQLTRLSPECIILLDQAESALYDLQMEMMRRNPDAVMHFIIADVTDTFRLRQVFERFKPEIIFHASAYKHVPLMEDCPYEAIHTNLGGTKNVADMAAEFGVERFLMISTDKAVNPTNVMGASKRLCEIYIQSLAVLERTKTQYITTRFGNVLGSNGSVIPLFKKQIEKGGPVTITHKDIIRYFMTIPEACQLVLVAAFMGKGGEIFLFDMGDPIKIYDLAIKMISLSGFVPNKDIMIEEIGLRPGEKLYEELFASREKNLPTQHDKILIAKVRSKDYAKAQLQINELLSHLTQWDDMTLVGKMKEIMPRYKSNNSKYTILDNLEPETNS